MKRSEDDIVWKALADKSRRDILDCLKNGPCTTGQLCSLFPEVTRFGVMKHLKVLYRARLVITEERGREMWNHLNAVPLKQIQERWITSFQDQWSSKLLRLKHQLEKE